MMGLPALKRETETRARPRLVVVPSGPSRRDPRAAIRSRSVRGLRNRELFVAFAVAASMLALLGMARITVAARAAETSIESAGLRKAIKAERLKGDLLEIQQSALATPNRIQEIAGTTMRMAQAGRVCYIQLDGSEACAPANSQTSTTTGSVAPASDKPRTGVVSSVLRAALGEAQILLLGDVALASSR